MVPIFEHALDLHTAYKAQNTDPRSISKSNSKTNVNLEQVFMAVNLAGFQLLYSVLNLD